MYLQEAHATALQLVNHLRPHCEDNKIEIAGSIKRQCPHVNDIEIVCIPLSVHSTDLFGGPLSVNRIPSFASAVYRIGEKVRGDAANGRYCRHKVNATSLEVDIFMPQRHDYYRQLALRTGDRNYTRLHIATAWRRKGWVGTDDGLRLEKECTGKRAGESMVWQCDKSNPTLPPVWESEREFFDWLGIVYKIPKLRIG